MKVSIVGFGRMGRNHLEACLNLGLEVISICDPKITAEEVLSIYPKADFFNHLEDLLNSEIPDIGIIATTADSHFEVASRMMERNVRFILCEKPVVSSLSDGTALSLRALKSNVSFAVNHQMRYMEGYQKVRTLVEEYPLGDLRAMNVSASNIGLAMNGTHYFEAFSWLTNSRIERVTAWLDLEQLPNPRGAEFKDHSGQILCRNGNNQRLYLDIGADLGHEIIVDYAFRNGHITVNELRGFGSVVVRNNDQLKETTQRYGLPGIRADFQFSSPSTAVTSARTLSELISGGEYPSLADGLHTVAVAFAAIKSNELGSKEVSISDLTGVENSQPWA